MVSMVLLRYCFIQSVGIFMLVFGGVPETAKFLQKTCESGDNISSEGLETISTDSSLMCLITCHNRDYCVAFDFCKDTGHCVLYTYLDGTCVATSELCYHYQAVQFSSPVAPRSCSDIYNRLTAKLSGVYLVFTAEGIALEVYCDFYNGYGYTYFSSASLEQNPNLSDHYTSRDHVMIRYLQDGQQKEAKIQQLQSYVESVPLTFLMNDTTSFTDPRNIAMRPFLMVGFLPTSFTKREQGYSVNGVDYTFTTCGAITSNSYFVTFSNPENLEENTYWTTCCDNNFIRRWNTQAATVETGREMPAKGYFLNFELHMGGCGGYISTATFGGTVVGAAVGLRFDLT